MCMCDNYAWLNVCSILSRLHRALDNLPILVLFEEILMSCNVIDKYNIYLTSPLLLGSKLICTIFVRILIFFETKC